MKTSAQQLTKEEWPQIPLQRSLNIWKENKQKCKNENIIYISLETTTT